MSMDEFTDALSDIHRRHGQISEAQLTEPVSNLFRNANCDASVQPECFIPNLGVRPDLTIYMNQIVCGYVELKAPGMGADGERLTGDHNRRQWGRLRELPNLIYTDGLEWFLYRYGRKVRFHELKDDAFDLGNRALTPDDRTIMEAIILDFFNWQPIVPNTFADLATFLAPLTKLLRQEVSTALEVEESLVFRLKNQWEKYFSPDLTNDKFSDEYAQTVVYAMLLAKMSGTDNLTPDATARTLSNRSGVLAQVLQRFSEEDICRELNPAFDLLQRCVEAIDMNAFEETEADFWLYFYEDFLAAYDPDLRRSHGVYYTPREVVEFQVRMVDDLLKSENHFNRKDGFAAKNVAFLDPATGTGTYPIAAIKKGLQNVNDLYGPGLISERAKIMARNLHCFEILTGAYAVAHLRIRKTIEDAMGEQFDERLKIYLTNTLESPNAEPEGAFPDFIEYMKINEEREGAMKVKNRGDIIVCIGNPPYNRRGDLDDPNNGGWVRKGDAGGGGGGVLQYFKISSNPLSMPIMVVNSSIFITITCISGVGHSGECSNDRTAAV